MRTTIFICALCLSACATTVAVGPGHRAVVMTPDGQLRVLDEGVSAVPVGALVDDINLREQTVSASLSAISADGVALVVVEPTISYSSPPDELVELTHTVPLNARRDLVLAVVQSAVGAVLAQYPARALDANGLRTAEAQILTRAAARLRPYHLLLDALDLKSVTPKMPALQRALIATAAWEQRAATAQNYVDVARQGADRRREEAAGLVAAFERLAPTLTDGVLHDAEIKAWGQLLTAPTTRVRITDERTPMEIQP